jgi:hypothetical protein
VKITWIRPSGLTEFPKATALALLDENLKSLHKAVNCKDYLQDLFWCEYTKREDSQYGFYWKPTLGEPFLTQEWYIVGFTCSNKFALLGKDGTVFSSKNIEGLTKVLHHMEKCLDIPESTVQQTDKDEFFVKFHRKWTEKPTMLSTFLLMCRAGLDYSDEFGDVEKYLLTIGDIDYAKLPFSYSDNAVTYLSSLNGKATLDKLFQGKPNFRLTWESMECIRSVHNYSGFSDYSGGEGIYCK